MNAAQIHLALNHAPLFLAIIGGILLIVSLITKKTASRNIALYMLVAGALFTLPVYFTGEGTEELVEDLPGVAENMIEQHEDMAKTSLIVILITGVAALVSLFLQKNPSVARAALVTTAVLSLASFGLMAQTAHLGGQIRHSEIRNGNAAAVEGGEQKNEKEEDDDEKEKGTTITPAPTDSVTAKTAAADSLLSKPEKKKEGKDDDY